MTSAKEGGQFRRGRETGSLSRIPAAAVPRRIYYATVIPISIELLPQTNKNPKTSVKPAKLFAIIDEARGEVDLRTLDAIAYTTYRPDKKELCIEIQFIASD